MGREAANSLRNAKLVAEAMVLTKDIAAAEKKREADLIAQYGKLAVWYDENIESDPVNSFVADRAVTFVKDRIGMTTVEDLAEEGLKQALLAIIRLVGAKAGSALVSGVGISAGILLAGANNGGLKGGYSDTRAGGELDMKKARLTQIYSELFFMDPPLTPVIGSDACATQACLVAP